MYCSLSHGDLRPRRIPFEPRHLTVWSGHRFLDRTADAGFTNWSGAQRDHTVVPSLCRVANCRRLRRGESEPCLRRANRAEFALITAHIDVRREGRQRIREHPSNATPFENVLRRRSRPASPHAARTRRLRRTDLLTEIWGYVDESVATRSVDHAIARLRKKIEPDSSHPQFILTAHGDGYCLCMNEEPETCS